MRLRISSRQSDLAKLQAYKVKAALLQQFPDLQIEFQFRESLGDKNLVDPLWKSPEKGVFTEDFFADLLSGKTDLVVHSWKDLPTEEKAETFIAATLPRADQRDLLLFKKASRELSENSSRCILSSSPRRAYNLEPFLRHHLPLKLDRIEFANVRGNVQTRVKKLLVDPKADGLIVAKAAMDRLLETDVPELQETRNFLRSCLQELDFMVLPLAENPTAAAQGALAIEILKNRSDLASILGKINCPKTFRSAMEERRILKNYGGGCHQKIGVSLLPLQDSWGFFLRGLTDQGVLLNQSQLLPSLDLLAAEHSTTGLPYDWSSEGLNESADRQLLDCSLPSQVNALYVSRAQALPKNWDLKDKIIWTPGVKTWQHLAAQGVWVHGCQEGLGEGNGISIGQLSLNPLHWARLTFTEAWKDPESFIPMDIATYRASPVHNWPDFHLHQRLYWSSASLFCQAFSKFPELIDKQHYCRPGRTFKGIQAFLSQQGLAKRVSVNVHQGQI